MMRLSQGERMPICKDPITKMVADKGYTGVRYPRADIRVGALVGRQKGRVLELGSVAGAFTSPTALPEPSAPSPAVDFEGKKSSSIDASLGIDVLEELLKVIGGGASLKAAYKGARTVTFQVTG